MRFSRQYERHLELDWRVVGAVMSMVDGEQALSVSLAIGGDSVIHDTIDLTRDAQRLAEFEESVGDYGCLNDLLDRRLANRQAVLSDGGPVAAGNG
jgi:hypothetical protein